MNDMTVRPQPWWRFPIVWMVFGGPAIVVVAAVATTVIAVRGADPEVRDRPAAVAADAMAPATQARNHAVSVQR